MPNDANEQERIDVKYHGMHLAMDGKLFYAPIENPGAILDIGTGTGIWALDTADAYPGATVVGTDLSPIQPNYVPTNLQFEIADADEEWVFDQQFDLIHCRVMNDFSLRSWPNYFQQAFEFCRQGGWVECQEFDYNRRSDDDTIAEDSRMKFWETEWTRGMEQIGLKGACDPDLVMSQMRTAGFINVTRLNFKLPIGPWPKDERLRRAGLFGLVNLLDGVHGLSIKIFTNLLGYSPEDLEVLLEECRREAKSKAVHSYWPV